MLKKILFLMSGVLLSLTVVSYADQNDLTSRVSQLEYEMSVLKGRVTQLEGHSNGSFGVTSEVSLACVKTLNDHQYGYLPSESQLLQWATRCRGTVSATKCELVQETFNSDCVGNLLSYRNDGTLPDESTLAKFSKVCETRYYICKK